MSNLAVVQQFAPIWRLDASTVGNHALQVTRRPGSLVSALGLMQGKEESS